MNFQILSGHCVYESTKCPTPKHGQKRQYLNQLWTPLVWGSFKKNKNQKTGLRRVWSAKAWLSDGLRLQRLWDVAGGLFQRRLALSDPWNTVDLKVSGATNRHSFHLTGNHGSDSGNHPQMAQHFRLVKCYNIYNLPRDMDEWWMDRCQITYSIVWVSEWSTRFSIHESMDLRMTLCRDCHCGKWVIPCAVCDKWGRSLDACRVVIPGLADHIPKFGKFCFTSLQYIFSIIYGLYNSQAHIHTHIHTHTHIYICIYTCDIMYIYIYQSMSISGWWFGTWLLFFHILGISSSQLTNSIIFQRG